MLADCFPAGATKKTQSAALNTSDREIQCGNNAISEVQERADGIL
ncbi:hypothetical protein KUC_2128 [Vreelandella boliviensis LC1]|uniref:Uncharacterized protein n=1 Tax=Vreelandella boliviensis LC1 TaxID=1072583 RepID=A0A7U9BZB8_9GAMM|nr:hypothetical protein KUC_2128 [Halomonas boliviensis LC1]